MIITSNATRIRAFFAVKNNTQVIINPGINDNISKSDHDVLMKDEPVYARSIENGEFIIGEPKPAKVEEKKVDKKEAPLDDKLKMISENFDKKSLSEMLKTETDEQVKKAIKEQIKSIK